MADTERDRWEHARLELISRWREIVRRIDGHDEGGVLELANVMDEFCEEAILDREASQAPSGSREGAPLKKPVSASTEVRCRFCRGFTETGGCLSLLESLNGSVLEGEWAKARHLATGYIELLQTMNLAQPSGEAIN